MRGTDRQRTGATASNGAVTAHMKCGRPISGRMIIPCLLTALACVGSFAMSIGVVSAAEPRRVLLLHAFGHPYSPWSDMAGSFRAELVKQSPDPIDLYEESLDTARIQDPKDEGPFVEYIRALVSGRNLDLIVPVGSRAAEFMHRHRPALFPATPMLILGANARRLPNADLTSNDTAVLLQEPLGTYLENILRLRPETTEVAVVIGNSPEERYWIGELRRDFQPWAGRVHFSYLNDLTLGEMLQRAGTMPAHSAILWTLLTEDAAGVTYPEDRALSDMRQVANAPIFGIGDYELGRGIVGGSLEQTQTVGREGARVAVRILKGERAADIKPVLVALEPPMYDWRELQRWNIPEALLPPNSVVQFRGRSIWQLYRWQILSAGVFMLLETALILNLLIERHRRREAELQARGRLSELAHMNRRAEVGELSASLAHELTHPLGAILRNSDVAEMILESTSPDIGELKEIVAEIRHHEQRASEVIKRLRRLFRKETAEVEEFDLDEALTEVFELLAPQAAARHITLHASLAPGPLRVSGDRIQLQQVILNLVINSMDAIGTRSGECAIVGRTAVVEEFTAQVSIEDSGSGIPADKISRLFEPFFTTKEAGMGMGLSIARTIVQTHGGRIWGENREGGGAVFRFTLPLIRSAVKVDAELPGVDKPVTSSERN